MSTPASSRPRPTHINVHEVGDYPIILGESLKDTNQPRANFMQLKYNWEPRNGFSQRRGILKQSNDNLRLTYQDDQSSSPAYTYEGFATSTRGARDTPQLVLVFDESKTAFVLEKVSASIDLNVTSAPNQSREDIRRHRQIQRSPVRIGVNDRNGLGGVEDDDDADEADPSNPYDFRHFLTEAKEATEKTTQVGSRTPVPGGHTPLSRVASPSLAAGRFAANSSSFRPTPTSAPLATKNKPLENGSKTKGSASVKKPALSKRKDVTMSKSTSHQPLSKERIVDSDEESDTITVHPLPPRGHTRNLSSTRSHGHSPHIVVNDGDLEVDLGSPQSKPKRVLKIDRDAFRSQTGTPTLGFSSNRRTAPRTHDVDMEMDIDMNTKDRSLPAPASEDDETYGEVHNHSNNNHDQGDNHEEDDEEEEDDDVDELELGSPQAKKTTVVTEQHLDRLDPHIQSAPTPPTPQAPVAYQDDDDDEDDGLAEEILKALEEDDDDNNNNDGTGYRRLQDDESEVSEEE